MYGCVFEHPALMLRKDVLTDNNIRYEKEYTPAEDYVLLGRLLEKTEFMNLPEVLLLYRSHESNTSHVRSEQMETAKHKAMALIRQEHPSIWERAQREVTRWIIHKLFGFIPVMITEMCEDKTRYLLFGVLPLLITRRQGRKMRHSLFGVLPLLYSKKKEKLIDIV